MCGHYHIEKIEKLFFTSNFTISLKVKAILFRCKVGDLFSHYMHIVRDMGCMAVISGFSCFLMQKLTCLNNRSP